MDHALFICFEELLPFVRGCDLLALALTCRFLHKRIFDSRQWNALYITRNITHTWNYGLLEINLDENFDKALELEVFFEKYLKTNLPIGIKLFMNYYSTHNYQKLIALNPSWLNSVTSIDKINCPQLKCLITHRLIPEKLEYVGLQDFNLPHEILIRLTRVKTLRLYWVPYSISHFNVLPSLKKLEILTEDLNGSNLQPLNNVTILSIRARSMKNTFALNEWKKLKILTISTEIEDISFLDFLENLEYFDFNPSSLLFEEQDFLKFPSNPPKKLKTFILNHMKNRNLDFLSGWTCLETLRVRSTEIMNIDALETCINLKKFDCQSVNQLKPLAKCLNLVELSLEKCIQNDWESLSGLPNLQCVKTNFDGSIPESFSKLKISHLMIQNSSEFPFTSELDVTLSQEFLKGLTHLHLAKIKLRSISFLEYATGLTSLRMQSCKVSCYIRDIQPLSHLIQLEVLDLSNNWIKNISPLSGLPKLRSLNLWSNFIVDIEPLSNLLELEKLNLGHNKVRDVKPLFGLKKLFILDLSLNNVPKSDLKKLMRWKHRFSDS